MFGDLITTPIHHDCVILQAGCINHSVIPTSVGQYTGVKDKNDCEIWEGDIVFFEGNENPHFVKFSQGAFRLFVDERLFVYNINPKSITVCGNIHESPDVIKRTVIED